ncbi:MAG TPA: hypothetical protein VEJ44_06455 [Acidimicrobiales bacterium]|nr:hypothetical protein [Acidimicrobiales bacterium]
MGAALPLVTLTASLVLAGPAGAAQPRTFCERWVAADLESGTFSGCDHGAATGGSGTAAVHPPADVLVISWASGKTTDVDDLSITPASPGEPGGRPCPPSTSEYEWHGTISADTTGAIPVGGSLSGDVCIDFTNGTSSNKAYARIAFS